VTKRKKRERDTGEAEQPAAQDLALLLEQIDQRKHQIAERKLVALVEQIDQRKAERQALERELEAVIKQIKQAKAETPGPRVVVTSKYYPNESFDMKRLVKAFGTQDRDFVNGLTQQLIYVGAPLNLDALSFMIAVIKGIKPKDQLEAMLAAQMATIHFSTMMLARRFCEAETLVDHDSAERTLNKLARTFTNQLEALKRYRTGGEQNVTVQHVQAIHVTQAARGSPAEIPANATAALTDERQSAMPIMDKPERSPIPVQRGRNDDGDSSA